MESPVTQLHATCVSMGGKGVLLMGESGSGKSDLALRLIGAGAELVADDRVDVYLSTTGGELMACAPLRLQGLLEVRGIGIVPMPFNEAALLFHAVRLVKREVVERMPEPEFFDCLGVQLPLHSLHAFDHSAPDKIKLLLSR